ncbi:MAG TPA: lipid-A-disaccharide synthase [Opitutaceae bacterium]|nr:lipid-A-disaccharide synthase [Opitutaceae bacterium]
MSAAPQLPPPATGTVDLLVIAGEHSGDEHAARVVRELRAKRPATAIAAVGGPRLAAAGAQLLFDLTASSTMGFAVVRKLSFYRQFIAEVVRWIGVHRPRAVCFVDSSGLNLRIARALFDRGLSAKAGGPTRTLYYISPQVWASRAKRRFAMARHLDALAAIFPFEPEVYADAGLPVTFVGHPFVAPDYAAPVRSDPAGPVLLLPGSRKGVVTRVFPVLVGAYQRLGGVRPAVVLYPSDEVLAVIQRTPLPPGVTCIRTGDSGQPVGAAAALTTSGTMSMHCALAGIPGAVTYRTDPLTYALGRLLVKVKHIGIANLLLGESMYPEYIQGAATPEALAAELRACLEDPARRERTAAQATRLRQLLAQPAEASAADWMIHRL